MNFTKSIQVILFVICAQVISSSQKSYFIRVNGGNALYQGDLAPKPLKASFGISRFSYGVSVGLEANSWILISLSYQNFTLAGDDKFADTDERRARNLRFFSPCQELSINSDLFINKWLKSLNKYNMKLFVSAGFGSIFFDPRTTINNQVIRLQPLGTEGQYLQGSGLSPYSLQSFIIPYGGRVEFPILKDLNFGVELKNVRTFTDYIDDVSGTYPDIEDMLEKGNIISAALSDRSVEIPGLTSGHHLPGQMRGNPSRNDRYVQFGLYLKYTLGSKRNLEKTK